VLPLDQFAVLKAEYVCLKYFGNGTFKLKGSKYGIAVRRMLEMH
jgi:hypothetical protein